MGNNNKYNEKEEAMRKDTQARLEEIERTRQAARLLASNLSKALGLLDDTIHKVKVLEEQKVPRLENEVTQLKEEVAEIKQNGNGGEDRDDYGRHSNI